MADIDKTVTALKNNGIEAMVVENGLEAKEKVLALIPKGASVMTMTSVTTDSIGLTEVLNSEEYKSARNVLYGQSASPLEKKIAGNLAEWTVGSVHAVTEEGKVLIASNTGSQLPAYAYSSDHVIWVVGQQKLVVDLEAGMKRLTEYVLPLESERARKAYGVPGSNISKLLIVNNEIKPGRITMVIVKENLGY